MNPRRGGPAQRSRETLALAGVVVMLAGWGCDRDHGPPPAPSTTQQLPPVVTVELRFPLTRTWGSYTQYAVSATCNIVVRRPPASGQSTGFGLSSRAVRVAGRPFMLMRIEEVLSPPPAIRGVPRPSDPATYHPQYDVLDLGPADVLIRRNGAEACTDADVEEVLRGLVLR